jgi:hypothetical protein
MLLHAGVGKRIAFVAGLSFYVLSNGGLARAEQTQFSQLSPTANVNIHSNIAKSGYEFSAANKLCQTVHPDNIHAYASCMQTFSYRIDITDAYNRPINLASIPVKPETSPPPASVASAPSRAQPSYAPQPAYPAASPIPASSAAGSKYPRCNELTAMCIKKAGGGFERCGDVIPPGYPYGGDRGEYKGTSWYYWTYRAAEATILLVGATAPQARIFCEQREATAARDPSGTASGDFTPLLDRVVAEDSKSWVSDRYSQGTMRNVRVVSGAGSNSTIHGDYNYTDARNGWVEVRLSNGKASCALYWNFPNICRPIGFGLARQLEAAVAIAAAAAIIDEAQQRTRRNVPQSEGNRQFAAQQCRQQCDSSASQCRSNNSFNGMFAGSGGVWEGMAAASTKDCGMEYNSCVSSCR